jgi:deoxyribonuclease IV
MLPGAHVPAAHPLRAADERGAEVLQVFLSPPRSWRPPATREDAAELRRDARPIHVHTPYLLNLVSGDAQVRERSVTSLQQSCEAALAIGAVGVVVHGGQAPLGEDPGVGIRRWRAVLTELRTEVPVLIENTAGGRNPMARTIEQIERLFDGLSGLSDPPGFCLDTCHLHAAGEPQVAATSRLRSLLGAIDLVHLNDAEGPPGTGRDRHANLGHGTIGRDALLEAVATAEAPCVIETPGTTRDHRADLTWVRQGLAALREGPPSSHVQPGDEPAPGGRPPRPRA